MLLLFAVLIILLFSYVVNKYLPMSSLLFGIAYNLYTRTYLGYLYHLMQLSKSHRNNKPHSQVTSKVYEGLKILPISILTDNYSYLVIDSVTKQAIVVDPSDPDVVKGILKQENVHLEAILTTHKHWDHSGGNFSLKEDFPHIAVYGTAMDNVPCLTHPVESGDTIQVGSLTFLVLTTPGHTTGHAVYILQGAQFGAPNSLFSGDLLFLGGCGRIFEGSPSTMYKSLHTVSTLKEDTLLWPGHEYALKNLLFSVTIEPENIHLQSKIDWVQSMSNNNMSSSPSTIGEEKLYNPFLRTHVAEVIAAVGLDMPFEDNENLHGASVLKALRERKEKFKT